MSTRRRLSLADELEICRLYEDDFLFIREIASMFGTCYSGVRRILRTHGVRLRSQEEVGFLKSGKAFGVLPKTEEEWDRHIMEEARKIRGGWDAKEELKRRVAGDFLPVEIRETQPLYGVNHGRRRLANAGDS